QSLAGRGQSTVVTRSTLRLDSFSRDLLKRMESNWHCCTTNCHWAGRNEGGFGVRSVGRSNVPLVFSLKCGHLLCELWTSSFKRTDLWNVAMGRDASQFIVCDGCKHRHDQELFEPNPLVGVTGERLRVCHYCRRLPPYDRM
ncbi:hypothetical protein PFISCL1PPCAC_6216, partial [Pristionchus fissidentatus]